jgi:uncharacterized protein YegJ (DUF2314 family)
MNNDPLFWLRGTDEEMNAAIRRAQESFPEFVRELELESRRIVPALDCAVVKAFFCESATPELGEHMFVSDVRLDGEMVHGVLTGTPQFVTGLNEGQPVSFPRSRVSDWFIVTRGQGKGGHTIDLIARRMDRAAYRAAASQPPFSWFAWRQKPWWRFW